MTAAVVGPEGAIAMAEVVGSVDALWRFPVKSMLGEQVDEVVVNRRTTARRPPGSGRPMPSSRHRAWCRTRTTLQRLPTSGSA